MRLKVALCGAAYFQGHDAPLAGEPVAPVKAGLVNQLGALALDKGTGCNWANDTVVCCSFPLLGIVQLGGYATAAPQCATGVLLALQIRSLAGQWHKQDKPESLKIRDNAEGGRADASSRDRHRCEAGRAVEAAAFYRLARGRVEYLTMMDDAAQGGRLAASSGTFPRKWQPLMRPIVNAWPLS